MTIPETKCKVQINYHPPHHHKLSWQHKSGVFFFPNRSMNTTKLWADNRNLVAEGTLASLLWQLLGGLSRLQEAPTPLKAAPVWGAKVFSPGAKGWDGAMGCFHTPPANNLSLFPPFPTWEAGKMLNASVQNRTSSPNKHLQESPLMLLSRSLPSLYAGFFALPPPSSLLLLTANNVSYC